MVHRTGLSSGVRRFMPLATWFALDLPDGSVDFVVSSFGLKTFSREQMAVFAREVHRILRTGGEYSFIEISMPRSKLLGGFFRFYVSRLIPLLGRAFLRDVECYRMLGVYTEAFGSCHHAIAPFRDAGFDPEVKSHFFGCATSITGTRPT